MIKDTSLISIVIPCYNEAENIRNGVLEEVDVYLRQVNYLYEVIISDDGATDGTWSLVEKKLPNLKNFIHLKNPHGGKPAALLAGINKARGQHILFTDIDQSTPISEIEKLLPKLKNNKVVIGSRGLKRKNFPWYRKLGAAVFSNFRRALILPELKDTQCGFKLFDALVLKKAFPKLEFFKDTKKVIGWKVTSFDVELLHILKKMGCNIAEVEVIWKDRDNSTSKGGALQKYIKESKEMVLQILRVKANDLKGMYHL